MVTSQHADPVSDAVIIKPGEIVQGNHSISVINTGDNNLRYRIFAGWIPISPNTHAQTDMAAEKLYVIINKLNASSNNLYTGPLSELLNWPSQGRFLPPYATEELQIFLSLPVVVIGLPPNPTIQVDFTFVAEQA